MSNPLESARERYVSNLATFEAAAEQMRGYLDELCRASGIRAEIAAREKDVSSFVKKIVTKPDYAADPWNKTTDKVGARVIVETRFDLSAAEHAIETSGLEIKSIDNKRRAEPDKLVYPGTHIQVVVPDAVMPDDGSPIECEVQVRTQAEDVWSVPSHRLAYKGAIAAPRNTQRRLWRLSVLVEMFDEEIERAIEEVSSMPGYEYARLLDVAEGVYLTFVVERGDRDLSMEVVRELVGLVDVTKFSAYESRLVDFGKANRSKLSDIYADFGCHSAWAGDLNYWLFSQPESVILFERIASDPGGVRNLMAGSELLPAVVPLFEAWGELAPTPS